jgi:peptidoglycan pentaglycine glycine transferase (the first glycine)
VVLDATSDLLPKDWDLFVATHPSRHLLQSSAWGALKSRFGWSAERIALSNAGRLVAGAQVLYRHLPLGLGRLAYVAKGPLVDWSDSAQVEALLASLDATARTRGAIALMIEPDLPDGEENRATLLRLGFRPAALGSIQPRRTIVVDIAPGEEEMLGRMKSKARYNIRLAVRRGVTVRQGHERDLPAFHSLTAATADRDRFGIHPPAYYEAAYELFMQRGWGRFLLAEVDGEPVAAVMAFAIPPRSWYLYGASGDSHREKMPTYLLQWQAMRWAKSLDCTSYDLWGVPDEDEGKLEEEFAERQGGLWGVYRFKRGFGGELARSVGAWDRPYSPARYWLYRWSAILRSRARRSWRST